MNNQYQCFGRDLTTDCARKLIQELFKGQTIQRRQIVSAVFEQHHERGGMNSGVRPNIIQSTLTSMKESGLAANPERGVWYITPYIETLNEFMEWAARFDFAEDSKQYLFRGVSNVNYRIDASAYRRIKKGRTSDEEQDGDFEIFLQLNKNLIKEARFRGHDQKNGRKLEDLEVLAEFQHYGAATFLMDFTYNALVALWFACKKSSDNDQKNGKVVAVPPNDPKFIGQIGEFNVITLETLEKKIDQLSPDNERLYLDNKKLYQWQPRQQQNERIIAQQSIFLFGVLEIGINPDEECIIDGSSKKKIRESLKRIYGITEDTLFPDFDGFARQNSQDVPYTQLSSVQYHQRGYEASQRGEYESAIADYSEAIRINPNDATVYYNRGTSSYRIGRYESAIADFDEAIRINPNDERFYNNRGLAKTDFRQYESAIADFDEAIRINPNDVYFHYHRGLVNNNLEEYESAIADFDETIRINSAYAEAYYHRGLARFYLGQDESTITDYDEAHLNPDYAFRQYLEEYELAIADFDETIRINSDYAEAFYHRGLVKQHMERYESAIVDYNEAIRINPNYTEAFYQRGLVNYSLHRFNQMQQDLQTALQWTDDIELIERINYLLYEIDSRTTGGSQDE